MEAISREAHVLLSAAFAVGGSYRNGFSNLGVPKAARKLLFSQRRTLEGSLSALVGALEDDENEFTDADSIVNLFSSAQYQLKQYTSLFDHLYPAIEADEIELGRLTNQLGEKLDVKASNNHKDYYEDIKDFEENTKRKIAARVRVMVANSLTARAREHLGLGEDVPEPDQIRRTIEFAPEFKQAGISILNYFSEILDSKYPDTDVRISIEQQSTTVVLCVETPEGLKERVERDLNDYGLVITGQLSPDSLLPDKRQVMALEHKLDIAALEVRQTRELLEAERDGYQSQVQTLTDCLNLVSKQLSETNDTAISLAHDIRKLAMGANAHSAKLIARLVNILTSEDLSSKEDEALALLVELRQENPSVVSKIEEVVLKGAVSGAAGNFLYSCILALGKMI